MTKIHSYPCRCLAQLSLVIFDAAVGEGAIDGDGPLGAIVEKLRFVMGETVIKEEFLGEDKSK